MVIQNPKSKNQKLTRYAGHPERSEGSHEIPRSARDDTARHFAFCTLHYRKGQSTLEIIIAITVLAAGITAAILALFGGQSLSLDSQEANVALRIAQMEIEKIESQARYDFTGITSSSSTEAEFTKNITVVSVSTSTKRVTVRLSWRTDPLRLQDLELVTHVTDWQGSAASGGDTGGGGLTGDWANPRTLGSIDLGPGVSATDLDVVSKMVYMSGEASASSKPDFFIVNATDGENPYIVSNLNTTNQGLEALDVAGNYVYAANNNNADDKQLQVIDITDKANPSLLAEYTLPDSTEKGISIFYSNQKAYVGTEKNGGPEFFIVDVSTPANPVSLGSKEIGYDVNAIQVSGNTAYIATPDDKELKILNVSDPANITVVGEYNVVGSCEDGKSMYLVGIKLYFGRTEPCGHDDHHKFSILDITNASNVSSLGSTNIGADVNGIVVRDTLAFIGTDDPNKEFQVWNISNPASTTQISSFNFPQVASGVDYEDNLVYVSVRSNDALRIITSQ